nr:alpha/beta fold hydrolase [Arthrobacter roseus]
MPGVEPGWSCYIDVPSSAPVDGSGVVNRWHYLDNASSLASADTDLPTLLCVHGNPTWSYGWRSLLSEGAAAGYRVVAVDQLDMGFSERTGRFRRLTDRVTDLEDFAVAAGITGSIITVGHDWGGVISLGFAHRNRDRLAGLVLTNTAIHHNDAEQIPAPLRAALHPLIHRWGTQHSKAFLSITHSLAQPALPKDVRRAFEAPYQTSARRQGIANFVADIPASPNHPSHAPLKEIAEGIRTLDAPALMLWGPKDPIFSDRYLEDLCRRLPHAAVHRFERASHLVTEDADVAGTLFRWLRAQPGQPGQPGQPEKPENSGKETPDDDGSFTPMWHHLDELAAGATAPGIATADMGADGAIKRSLSWQQLAASVSALAESLHALGVRRGSRISLMVPPGVDLTIVLYACLKLGAVIVVADAGLGVRGMSRAVKSTSPEFLIGISRALIAAKTFSWPGRRISVDPLPKAQRRLLSVETSIAELTAAPTPAQTSGAITPTADPDADAAILFTSGSTGPAKGVVYTHRQLTGMRDTVASTFGLGPGHGLVAGFAPFALLGPALGTTSITPDMDVTAPRTLSAQALADAAGAIDATTVFASPAALQNVLATAPDLTTEGRGALSSVRLLLSAGAPVSERLLTSLQEILPKASLHTPYGMTEALPVSDIDLEHIRSATADVLAGNVAGAGNGVCVGHPVQGVNIVLSPLDHTGTANGPLTSDVQVTGEILVQAPHVKDRYHRLWLTQQDSARNSGWHRTGDVGHFDAKGRLWVEGRIGHVLTTADGVVTPVGIEQALEGLPGITMAAVVGVGPAGTQAAVAVLVTDPPITRAGLAAPEVAAAARSAAKTAGVPLAAVLTVRSLPTDIRHNAKIDRTRVALWAERTLAGGKVQRL